MNNTNIHIITRAVIILDNQILTLFHKEKSIENRYYFFPGGHIEHGETAINSLKRELIEELGFNFEIRRFLGCLEHDFTNGLKYEKNTKCHTHEYNLFFEAYCHDIKSNIHIIPPELDLESKWIDISKLTNYNILPDMLSSKNILNLWLKEDYNDAFRSETY